MAEGAMPTCDDAVIVVPGIMGSELVDVETNTLLWGLSAKRYASFWTSDSPWEKLKITDDERAGKTGRVAATRLLRFPGFAPILRGIEPYARLAASIRDIAPHPAAVLEYPYDWRLSVAHNAAQLAKLAGPHLEHWRKHPCGNPDAKLILVAHSMGGLIARFLTGVLGWAQDVRLTVTIGTPFQGSVKAVFLLNRGKGGPLPLPQRRLMELARTLPGVYDLLPSYRCLVQDGITRRLTSGDIGSLGGDTDLAKSAADLHAALSVVSTSDLRTIVGVEQPTMQSLLLRNGTVEPQYYIQEVDGPLNWRGDGTVYVQVAAGGVEPISSLPQSHGALARTAEAFAAVREVLTRRRLGPPMGASGISLDIPEWAIAGELFRITVASDGRIHGARYSVIDADNRLPVAQGFLSHQSDAMIASVRLPRPGLYRVTVKSGGYSGVSQLMLATAGN